MKIRTSQLKNGLVYLLGLFSPIMLVSIGTRPIYYHIALLIALLGVIRAKRNKYIVDRPFMLFAIFLCVSTIVCQLSEIPGNWKNRALMGTIWFLVISLFYHVEENSKKIVEIPTYINGLRLGFILNVIWSYLQFFIYSTTGANLNKIVFENYLGKSNVSSWYRQGRMLVTGFWAHPQCLVAVLTISYFLFDNAVIRLLLIIVSVLTGNGTAIIGMACCIVSDLIFKTVALKSLNKRKMIRGIGIVIFIVAAISILSSTNIGKQVNEQLTFLSQRLSNNTGDVSASLHIRYFTGTPTIFSKCGIIHILFGYGHRCSGYPFNHYFGQFSTLDSWVTECDVINKLMSYGIIGCFLFYFWAIRICIKGYKVNWKYTACIMCILLEGIMYEIQMDWVLIFEMICCIAIRNRFDIFQSIEKQVTKK